ncbi:putative deacetylase [Flavobacteria bacterium BAL38]|nr:putative deacetylase [Flavobacteria bacterium BAL38]
MRKLLRNIYLNILGSIKKPMPGIHIINAHFASPNEVSDFDRKTFEQFLKIITKNAKIISLEKATQMIIDKQTSSGKVFVALTFDDGFEECHSVIAPLLEKYECKGAFFINANFIDSTTEYQNEFNKRVKIFTKKPMSWEQVKDLHNRGHLIGSHNLDHLNMADLNEDELEFQLKENKKILENRLDYNCNYFAWTYGQMQHFSEKALQITNQYHDFVYSGTNYKKYFSMNNKVINRRQIEPFWSKKHINYFLSINKVY